MPSVYVGPRLLLVSFRDGLKLLDRSEYSAVTYVC
jgi:hypothetical protein